MVDLIQREQLQIPDYLGSYNKAVEAKQNQQIRNVQLENYNNDRIKAERENQRASAIDELSRLSLSDPRAMDKLAQIDPERAKKNFDYLYQKSERAGAYATVINQAPRDKKPQVYEAVLNMARNDPLVDAQSLNEFPDKYTPDLDAKLYAVSQSHRTLENALKAQQEQTDLLFKQEQTRTERLQQNKIVADTRKTEAEIANIGLEGKLKQKELSGTKPLSGESAKISTIAGGGTTAIADLRELLGTKNINVLAGKSTLPNAFQDADTQRFNVLTTDLGDLLGRLRSGGQINGTELETYKKLIPKFGDSKKTQEYKLKRLDDIFGHLDEKLKGLPSKNNQPGGDPLGLFK